jgi:hypothetical protein
MSPIGDIPIAFTASDDAMSLSVADFAADEGEQENPAPKVKPKGK